jgi:predicted dehydrogenase
MGASICVIATETRRHLEDGILALDHGFNLLVEKPLTPTAPDANELLSHANSVGRSLYVGCVMRFSESLGTFREYLPQVGELHSVRIECQSYLPEWRPQRSYLESYAARTNEGGVLLDLIHEVDYAGWIFGWPQTVQGRVRNLGRLGIAADEAVELSWESSDGCLVSINLDYLSRQPRRIMRAYGSLGTVEWEGFGGIVTLMVEGEAPKIVESQQARNDTFLAQVRAFVEALHGNHDPRLATGEEGAWGLAVCDAARSASVSRREEMVAYP